jgi:hypothetical protein
VQHGLAAAVATAGWQHHAQQHQQEVGLQALPADPLQQQQQQQHST